MTFVLLVVLCWLLIGGSVYMLLLANIELGYKVWREEHIPTQLLDIAIKNKRLLLSCLLLGPIAIVAATFACIFALFKGELK